MSTTTVNLGMLPNNRGSYTSETWAQNPPTIYKDNIVEFNNSAYIYSPVSFSIDNPAASATNEPPYDAATPTVLNTGWYVFASGNNTFTTGEKVDNVGIDDEPTAGSDNLVKSGGVAAQISQLDQKVNGEKYESNVITLSKASYQSFIDKPFSAGKTIRVKLSGTAVFGNSAAWLYGDEGSQQQQKLGGVYVQNNNEYEITLNSNITFIGLRVYTLTTSGTVKMDVVVSGGLVSEIDKIEEDIDNLQSQINTSVQEIKDNIETDESIVGILHPEFEIGNISITGSGWSYNGSTVRVRLKQGTTVALMAGDCIRIGRGIEIYVGWLSQGVYGRKGWIEGPIDYIAPISGDYVINSRLVPESTITDISAITDNISIIPKRSNEALLENIDNLKEKTIVNSNYENICKAIAHRGLRHTYPENTIIGFKAARKLGFRYCETDVYFTSDGVAVLSHDATINRCARNADGSTISETITISEVTYEQLLTYDFGIYRGQQFAGTKIPRLDEFLVVCHHIGLHPYIELKGGTEIQIKGIPEIVRTCGMDGNVTYIGFHTNLLYIHSVSPFARLGELCETITSTIIDSALLIKDENEVFIDAPSFSVDDVALCANASLPLEVWGNKVDGVIVALTEQAIVDMPSYISGATTDGILAGKVIYDANINP